MQGTWRKQKSDGGSVFLQMHCIYCNLICQSFLPLFFLIDNFSGSYQRFSQHLGSIYGTGLGFTLQSSNGNISLSRKTKASEETEERNVFLQRSNTSSHLAWSECADGVAGSSSYQLKHIETLLLKTQILHLSLSFQLLRLSLTFRPFIQNKKGTL